MFVLLLHVLSGHSTNPIPKIENLPLTAHIPTDLLVSKVVQICLKKNIKAQWYQFFWRQIAAYQLQSSSIRKQMRYSCFSQQSQRIIDIVIILHAFMVLQSLCSVQDEVFH